MSIGRRSVEGMCVAAEEARSYVTSVGDEDLVR
jgi:hypothetical protein